MNIPDAYAHPLFNSYVDRMTGFRTRNLRSCAIRDGQGRNVAVLQVGGIVGAGGTAGPSALR